MLRPKGSDEKFLEVETNKKPPSICSIPHPKLKVQIPSALRLHPSQSHGEHH